jgi:cytochrome c5
VCRLGKQWTYSKIAFPSTILIYNRPLTALQPSIRKRKCRDTGFFNRIKEIMSDAHSEQQSFIQTPKQLIAAVAGFFLVIVIGIILLVIFATNKPLGGAGSAGLGAAAVTARIRPVADDGFVLKDANAPKVMQTGLATYNSTCVACHGSGAAGAPKVADTASWSARIGQGYDTLVQHAIHGIRAMPAKGGNPDLDDVEVARAVVYMANQSGAKFKDPDVPATATPPAQNTTPAPAAASAPATASPDSVAVPAPASTTAPFAVNSDSGKTLYGSACVACHGTGIAGAPKFGDKAAWTARIAQGTPVLYEHAIKGFQGKTGMMPPKGGSSASDADVKAAVDYMAAAAK